MKILLVDDNENVRNSFKRMLNAYNYDVLLADDGSTALDKLKNDFEGENLIKLVITDYQMKKMNGNELAKEMKRLNYRQPIILVSCNSEQMKNNPDFDYVLNKALDIKDLIEIIERVTNTIHKNPG